MILSSTFLQLNTAVTNPNIPVGSEEEIVLFFIKLMFILGGLIYVLFAVLVIRQVQLMRSTVKTKYSKILLIVSLAHLALALLALLYFIAI